jgi:type I restriction enzyme S subunit
VTLYYLFGDMPFGTYRRARVALVKRLDNSQITADSHVTIVRVNSVKADEIFLGISMLQKQVEIENFGEGSTGQIELSRENLGKLLLLLPNRASQKKSLI